MYVKGFTLDRFFELKTEKILKIQRKITKTQNSLKNQPVGLCVVYLCDYYSNKKTQVTVLHDHCLR